MRLKAILLMNLLGAALVVSLALPDLVPWMTLDDRIFWFFNSLITSHENLWDTTLALLNTRSFDFVSFAILALFFVGAIHLDDRPQRIYRWLGIGLAMLLTAGLIALLTVKGIHYGHPSPTRVFDQAQRLTDIVSIPTKDGSHNSFPGDHGLMLMIFVGFMLRFADSQIAWASVVFGILLSTPRIMVGAHWFSDVYMGSLAIALLILPWILLTPVGPTMAQGIAGAVMQLDQRMRH